MAEYIERGVAMDVREKLVKLLKTSPTRNGYTDLEDVADHLITNGVTVQEWISVDERMPDACGFPCLLCGENSFGQIRVFGGFTGYMERGKREWHSNQKDVDIDVWRITHWMPLPQPPKMDGGAENGKTDV